MKYHRILGLLVGILFCACSPRSSKLAVPKLSLKHTYHTAGFSFTTPNELEKKDMTEGMMESDIKLYAKMVERSENWRSPKEGDPRFQINFIYVNYTPEARVPTMAESFQGAEQRMNMLSGMKITDRRREDLEYSGGAFPRYVYDATRYGRNMMVEAIVAQRGRERWILQLTYITDAPTGVATADRVRQSIRFEG